MKQTFMLTLWLATASPIASAHVTATPDFGTAGTYFETALRIPHGCDGKATTQLTVTIPPEILMAKPQYKPGWQVLVTYRTLNPAVTLHGKPIRRAAATVTWKGGRLPDGQFDSFGLLLKLPDKPGAVLWLPVTQHCGTDKLAWTEQPASPDVRHHAQRPAPFIRVLPAGQP